MAMQMEIARVGLFMAGSALKVGTEEGEEIGCASPGRTLNPVAEVSDIAADAACCPASGAENRDEGEEGEGEEVEGGVFQVCFHGNDFRPWIGISPWGETLPLPGRGGGANSACPARHRQLPSAAPWPPPQASAGDPQMRHSSVHSSSAPKNS